MIPDSTHIDGVGRAFIGGATIGDTYDLWQTQWVGETQTRFFGYYIDDTSNGGGGNTQPGDCAPRMMYVKFTNRSMSVRADSREMVVPCKC